MVKNKSCPDCEAAVHWTHDRCVVCGHAFDPPIIRMIDTDAEREALDGRYAAARAEFQATCGASHVGKVEADLRYLSRAVINLPADRLHALLMADSALYSNYHLSIDAETRMAAAMGDDVNRCKVDSAIFGNLGKNIRFAALSLDARGAVNYGSCGLVVRDITCQRRATTMEENSFKFYERHALGPLFARLPPGFRARWEDRHKLAIAKLAGRLVENEGDLASILLCNGADRHADDFVEVHIYGPLNHECIEQLWLPRPEDVCDDEKPFIELIAATAARRQINVARP